MANGQRKRLRRSDPIVDHVRDWIADRDTQDALKRKWHDAERRLSVRISPLKITLMEAAEGDLPEARTMRALMRRIRAADRKLDRAAGEIVRMQPSSPLGALAKIEMAMRILAWMDDRDHAWPLLQSGTEKLRTFLLARLR